MTVAMESQQQTANLDAVNWFEIPTTDLDRAVGFYEMLLGQKMRVEMFGERIEMFPSSVKGVGGCLVQRDFQRPSENGALVLSKREMPGGFGCIACVRNVEGNYVALHEH